MRTVCQTIVVSSLFALTLDARASGTAPGPSEIEQFNQRFVAASRAMSDSAVLALWDDDGISLLPLQPPIVGKKALTSFLARVRSQYPDAHMESFDCECHDIEVAGDWASEWCEEHQVVHLPDKKVFDSRGKMLLVLHRDAAGRWRLKREMWNAASTP